MYDHPRENFIVSHLKQNIREACSLPINLQHKIEQNVLTNYTHLTRRARTQGRKMPIYEDYNASQSELVPVLKGVHADLPPIQDEEMVEIAAEVVVKGMSAEGEAMVLVADEMVAHEAAMTVSAKAPAIWVPLAEEVVLREAEMVVDETMMAGVLNFGAELVVKAEAVAGR